MSSASMLLITTDAQVISSFQDLAREAGAELGVAHSLRQAAIRIARRPFDVLFVQVGAAGGDIRRRLTNGLVLMNQPPVVAFGKTGSISDAVLAIRAGACDYLAQPPRDADALCGLLHSALISTHSKTLETHIAADGQMPFKGFITEDHRLLSVCKVVAGIANSGVVLLIEGERGTGKSLLARKLHENSFR